MDHIYRRDSFFPFYPDDSLIVVWNILLIFMLICILIIVPFRVCFVVDNEDWIILDYLFDSFFVIDMVLNFITAYYDEQGKFVHSYQQIAISYLTSNFCIDFLALFPFNYLNIEEIQDYNKLFRLMRLPRIYKLYKVIKINKM